MVKDVSGKKNKIVIWPSSFYPVSGGVQTVAKEIGEFLHENEWNVTFVTNRFPRKLDKKEQLNDQEIHRFTFLHSPLSYFKSNRFDLFFAWIFYKPITLIRLISFFSKVRPNIVHIHFPDNQVLEGLLLKIIFDFKLVVSFHGNDIEKLHSISIKSLRFILLRILLKQADLITGCSNFITNKVLETYPGINKEKITTLYNGVGKDFENPSLQKKKDDYFFTAARNAPVKGIDMVLPLVKIFKQHKIKVAGKGFKNNDQESKIIILGDVNSYEIKTNLMHCAICIVPSRSEAFGIIIAEALCCGSPVITTNVGGIPEVIKLAKATLTDEEILIFNDWVKLVEPNVKALTQGINDILKNLSPIKKYLDIIPKIQQQFTWDKRLKKYHNILSNLIS